MGGRDIFVGKTPFVDFRPTTLRKLGISMNTFNQQLTCPSARTHQVARNENLVRVILILAVFAAACLAFFFIANDLDVVVPAEDDSFLIEDWHGNVARSSKRVTKAIQTTGRRL
jgi:hypothetical protein